jgi:hypothetical protein
MATSDSGRLPFKASDFGSRGGPALFAVDGVDDTYPRSLVVPFHLESNNRTAATIRDAEVFINLAGEIVVAMVGKLDFVIALYVADATVCDGGEGFLDKVVLRPDKVVLG